MSQFILTFLLGMFVGTLLAALVQYYLPHIFLDDQLFNIGQPRRLVVGDGRTACYIARPPALPNLSCVREEP